ncbi:ABC transporter ATP-binding protein [Brevibacillus sp. NRS-1366]|uniref:ABC transporter ATP-binding protein n=1 Tax=Brevibacillus sp. NRS-1366 TaxID=3233899 RepID=UPI003D21D71D
MTLSLDQVGKSFGGLVALKDVSFTVKQGEVFGVIGPNGAGKTTLFNLITSMFSIGTGTIRFNGQQISGLKPHQIAKAGISRTFQNIRLFSQISARENVMVGAHGQSSAGVWSSVLRTTKQREEERRVTETADQLLELVGLEREAETVASALAYGQQRRLEIARALASSPKLILLDEPAAGMNETETEELFQLVKQIQKLGVTVLLIEHDMNLVMRICDRLAVLNFGEKIAEGKPKEVRENPAVIEAYLGGGEDGEIC